MAGFMCLGIKSWARLHPDYPRRIDIAPPVCELIQQLMVLNNAPRLLAVPACSQRKETELLVCRGFSPQPLGRQPHLSTILTTL